MIKFTLRHNLIYPSQLILWYFLRQLLIYFINASFDFKNSLALTPLMFTGELLGGGIIHLYLKKNYQNKKDKEKKPQHFMSIELLRYEEEDEDQKFIPLDNRRKIILLMFFCSFFDAIQFLLWTSYIPKFHGLSASLVSRMSSISTIFCSLFYIYVLKLPIFRHQKLSLCITALCLIIIIIFEFVFQKIDIFLTYSEFVDALIFIIITPIFESFINSTEKYLYEYDYMDPFVVLMYEGLFGFILSFLFFLEGDYFHDVADVNQQNSIGMFILFLFLLFVYIILSAGMNIFRVVTNKIYSPMTKTLTNYIMNPIFLFYYYGAQHDFEKDGKLNVPYFIINFFLSLIISFFGCVYNEFIVLFICGLENDTHYQISKRAILNVQEGLIKMDDISEIELN